MKTKLLLLLLALVMLFSFTACGEGGGEEGGTSAAILFGYLSCIIFTPLSESFLFFRFSKNKNRRIFILSFCFFAFLAVKLNVF